jgi:hypothetical protein
MTWQCVQKNNYQPVISAQAACVKRSTAYVYAAGNQNHLLLLLPTGTWLLPHSSLSSRAMPAAGAACAGWAVTIWQQHKTAKTQSTSGLGTRYAPGPSADQQSCRIETNLCMAQQRQEAAGGTFVFGFDH